MRTIKSASVILLAALALVAGFLYVQRLGKFARFEWEISRSLQTFRALGEISRALGNGQSIAAISETGLAFEVVVPPEVQDDLSKISCRSNVILGSGYARSNAIAVATARRDASGTLLLYIGDKLDLDVVLDSADPESLFFQYMESLRQGDSASTITDIVKGWRREIKPYKLRWHSAECETFSFTLIERM